MAKYYAKPVQMTYNGKKYLIKGEGQTGDNKTLIADFWAGDKMGWREVKNAQIKIDLYKEMQARKKAAAKRKK